MKKIQKLLLGTVAALGLVAALVLPLSVPAFAQPADQIQSGVVDVGGEDEDNLEGGIEIVINILLFLVGAVAVIMLVIGGFRYVVSGGDQNAINSAKNTILYAIIGIVVALLAYAIVNFVLGQFIDS